MPANMLPPRAKKGVATEWYEGEVRAGKEGSKGASRGGLREGLQGGSKGPRKRTSSTLMRQEDPPSAPQVTPMPRLKINGPVPPGTPRLRLKGPMPPEQSQETSQATPIHQRSLGTPFVQASGETSPFGLGAPVAKKPRPFAQLIAEAALAHETSLLGDIHQCESVVSNTQGYLPPPRDGRNQSTCDTRFDGILESPHRAWTQKHRAKGPSDMFLSEDEEEEEEEEGTKSTQSTAPVVCKKTKSQRAKSVSFPESVSYKLFLVCNFESILVKRTQQRPQIIGSLGSEINTQILLETERKKAEEHAAKKGQACHLISSTVLTSYERMSKETKAANEQEMLFEPPFWQSLEDGIIEWARKGKSELTIQLTTNWGRSVDGVIPTNNILPSTQVAPVKKTSATETAKLEAERAVFQARQSDTQAIQKELLERWSCKVSACKYSKGDNYCYVDSKQEHYPLSAGHTLIWAKAIHRDATTVTVEQPPWPVFDLLRQGRKLSSRKARANTEQQQKQPLPAYTVPSQPPAPVFTTNYYLAGTTESLDKHLPLPSMTPACSMSVASIRTQAPHTLASSPVRGEFTLRDYIDWHIKKAPEDAQLFDRAYHSMKEEGLLIEHIQGWKDIND